MGVGNSSISDPEAVVPIFNLIVFEEVSQQISQHKNLNLSIINSQLKTYLAAIGCNAKIVYLKDKSQLEDEFDSEWSNLRVLYVSKKDAPEFNVVVEEKKIHIIPVDGKFEVPSNVHVMKASLSTYYDLIKIITKKAPTASEQQARQNDEDSMFYIERNHYIEQHPTMLNDIKYLKSKRRVKNEYYGSGQCYLGVNNVPVKHMIAIMFGKYMSTDSSGSTKQNIRLVPFCNEQLLANQIIDRVNRPFMSLAASEAMEDLFNVKFEMSSLITIENNEIRGPDSSVTNFLHYIREKITSKRRNDRTKKNQLISRRWVMVSHGTFMRNLCQHLKTKLTLDFDNLDVIRIEFTPEMNECYTQLKFKDDYEIGTDIAVIEPKVEPKGTEYENDTHQYVYIIRHCIACHNVKSVKMITKLKSSYSGDHSMCTIETAREVETKAPFLKKMFDKDINSTGNVINRPIFFTSSIIFRAALTACLIRAAISKLEIEI